MADDLNRTFGELVEMLATGGFELLAMVELDIEAEPCQHRSYHAILVGLEGEVVMEYELAAEESGGPPLWQRMAVAIKAREYQKAWQERRPFFPVVEYEARERCQRGCCVWYHRITPLWSE